MIVSFANAFFTVREIANDSLSLSLSLSLEATFISTGCLFMHSFFHHYSLYPPDIQLSLHPDAHALTLTCYRGGQECGPKEAC